MSNEYQPPGGGPGQPADPGQGQPQYPQGGQPPYPGQGQPQYPQGGQPPYPGQGQPYPQGGQPPYPGQGQPYPQGGQPPYPGQGQPYPQGGQPPYPGQVQPYPQGQPGDPQQPYGQQPGQGPNGGQPEGGYPGPEQPPKKKRTGLVVAIVVVVVIALVLGAVFLLNGRMGSGGVINNADLSADPEGYLQGAMEKTASNRAEAPSPLPEFQDFSGEAIEQEFAMQIRGIAGIPEASGFSLTLGTQSDMRAQQLLIDLSVGYGPLQFTGNQVYISQDTMALSIPFLYSRNRYITVNPSTFEDDWNGSQFAREFGSLDFDLSEFVSEIFGIAPVDNMWEIDTDMFFALMRARTDQLFEEGNFLADGAQTITVNGRAQEVTKLSYNFTAEQTGDYVSDILGIMDDFMTDYYTQLGVAMSGAFGYNPYAGNLRDWREAVAVLEALTYPNGMKMAYYVTDDQLVPRIEIEEMSVYYEPDKGLMTVAFVLDMDGESSLGEYTMFDLTMRDIEDTIRVYFEGTASEGGTASNRGEFLVDVNGDELFSLRYDLEWEPGNNDGGLMKLDLELAIEDDVVAIAASGNLYDRDDEYRLDNGAVDITYNGENVFGMDFSYFLRAIDAVEIDLSEAVSLFDLDMEEFMNDLQNGIMALLYGAV